MMIPLLNHAFIEHAKLAKAHEKYNKKKDCKKFVFFGNLFYKALCSINLELKDEGNKMLTEYIYPNRSSGPDKYESLGNAALYFLRNACGRQIQLLDGKELPRARWISRLVCAILALVTLPLTLVGIASTALSRTYSRMQQQALPPIESRGSKRMRYKRYFQETIRACKNGFYVGDTQVRLDAGKITSMKTNTRVIKGNSPIPRKNGKKENMKIKVWNMDSFEAAKRLIDDREEYHPAVLNMACKFKAGGGVKRGCSAQEESLFRRSNAFQALYFSENPALRKQFKNERYLIPEDSAILSPGVQVFRRRENDNCAFIDPFSVDLISCAAYNANPGLNYIDKPKNREEYANGMKVKIRAILKAAIINGNDALVLGAFGCGAFANTPGEVAGFFKNVLEEPEFNGRFKKVVFAILNVGYDRSGVESNFDAFQRILTKHA